MLRKTWPHFLLALLACLGLLGYTSGWFTPPHTTKTLPTSPLQSPAATGEPLVTILVSKEEIKPYTLLNDPNRFKPVKYPASKIRESLEDTITSFDQVKRKVSRHYVLRPNEPIYLNDVAEPTASDRANHEVIHTLILSRKDKPSFEITVGDRLKLTASIPADAQKTTYEKFTMENIEVLKVVNQFSDATGNETVLLLRTTDAQSFILKSSARLGKIEISQQSESTTGNP